MEMRPNLREHEPFCITDQCNGPLPWTGVYDAIKFKNTRYMHMTIEVSVLFIIIAEEKNIFNAIGIDLLYKYVLCPNIKRCSGYISFIIQE